MEVIRHIYFISGKYSLVLDSGTKSYAKKGALVNALMKIFNVLRPVATSMIDTHISQVDTIEKCMGYIIAMDLRLEKLEKESENKIMVFREQKIKRQDSKLEKQYLRIEKFFEESLRHNSVSSYNNPQSSLFKTFQSKPPAIIDSTNYIDTIKIHMEKWIVSKNATKIYEVLCKKRNVNYKYRFEFMYLEHHLELFELMK
jgi:hypothetical protein